MRRSSQFIGGMILSGRDHAAPLLKAACHMLADGRRESPTIVLKERQAEYHSAFCSTQLDSDRNFSLQTFTVSDGLDFAKPLLIPSMNKDLREAVYGYPEYDQLGDGWKGADDAGRLCKVVENLSTHSKEQNVESDKFRERLESVLFSRLPGDYSLGLFLNGAVSTTILANRGAWEGPEVQVVMTAKCVALMWFSAGILPHQYLDKVREVDTGNNVPPLAIPIVTVRNSMIVLHPLYISTKWSRAQLPSDPMKSPRSKFIALNSLAKIIQKAQIPLRTQHESIVQQ